MKRLALVILSVLLCLSMVACSNDTVVHQLFECFDLIDIIIDRSDFGINRIRFYLLGSLR